MTEKIQILLIDDDAKFCRLISDYLSPFGFELKSVHTGPDGVAAATKEQWQAIILDAMLPGIDGFEVLRRLRPGMTAPVLMLTALGDEADRIVGLELGADDYLPKTSSPRELLARLRAVLRRTARVQAEKPVPQQPEIVVGPLAINQGARVAALDGEPLALTPVEFDLLVVL